MCILPELIPSFLYKCSQPSRNMNSRNIPTARRKMDLKPNISPFFTSQHLLLVAFPLPFLWFTVLLSLHSCYSWITLQWASPSILLPCCFHPSRHLNFFASHYPSAVSLIQCLSSFSIPITVILFNVWFADFVSFLSLFLASPFCFMYLQCIF